MVLAKTISRSHVPITRSLATTLALRKSPLSNVADSAAGEWKRRIRRCVHPATPAQQIVENTQDSALSTNGATCTHSRLGVAEFAGV